VICLAKRVRLFIKTRKQGSRIESVPLEKIKEMQSVPYKWWYYDDGWLVLGSG
jgi:hypothetical protein